MTDLERRALLGDREAQKECTEKGIVLPCPFCGSEAKIINLIGAHFVYCEECSARKRLSNSERRAVESWNTRVAPPVGRCGTCRWFADNNHGEWYGCKMFNAILVVPEDAPKADDFCSYYEPREADEK